ncbi:two-component sensor histidine kinase [Lysinibacillus piscis]|uniref:histidine kinase n=2 Tax=Lysinibacillus piscis TaxID=2518931 RepID=A0ABQ5NQ07_9BACI|nr:two-component sensor histidine kinase [Lysinibacillus sp. KH24]
MDVNRQTTAKKLDFIFWDKDLEQLTSAINHQIDLTAQAVAIKRRKEAELKQAIANISHDIRTPLTSILGYIQFLEREDLSTDTKQQYTMIIKRGAGRLKDLLEDFFELSLIESPDYLLQPEKIKINHLILETLADFYEQFKQSHLEPTIHIPTEDITVIADSSAMKRVVENLVLNTIKHAKADIVIRLEQQPKLVRLIISNQVEAFFEEDMHSLFQRFYKVDKTRTGQQGAGLGLAIAKSLMTKMDGQLYAQLTANHLSIVCEWPIQKE